MTLLLEAGGPHCPLFRSTRIGVVRASDVKKIAVDVKKIAVQKNRTQAAICYSEPFVNLRQHEQAFTSIADNVLDWPHAAEGSRSDVH
jgi:hypothetical protein